MIIMTLHSFLRMLKKKKYKIHRPSSKRKEKGSLAFPSGVSGKPDNPRTSYLVYSGLPTRERKRESHR